MTITDSAPGCPCTASTELAARNHRTTPLASRFLAGAVLAVILLATALVSGCGAASPAVPGASTQSCFAFGVRALRRHETVTRLPRSCAGLSREQVNAVVGRAIRDVAGPQPKAPLRRRSLAESRYLAGLVQSVPAAPAPAHRAAAAPSTTILPASLAALGCWLLTAAAGLYLLAGLLTRKRSGQRRLRAAGIPPAVIGGHAAFGLAGLGVWIGFVITAGPALGWIAVGTTFLTAGLGMATLLTAVPDSQRSDGAAAAVAAAAGRPPVVVIALHGLLATVTIVLVLTAVIGSG